MKSKGFRFSDLVDKKDMCNTLKKDHRHGDER